MSSAPPPQHRYQLPTHLHVPDTFSFTILGMTLSVTTRQGVILLFGGSSAFNLWRHLPVLDSVPHVGIVLHLLLPGLLVLVTFLVATLHIAGRYTEIWLLILLRYHLHPKRFLWRRQASSFSATHPMHSHSTKEER